MQRGLTLFVIITVAAAWIFGVAAWLLQDSMGQYAGFVMIPLAAIPMLAAFIAHRMSGAIGNPFGGLVWGPGGWFFGLWILGLIAGLLVVVLSLGTNVQSLDLEMSEFVRYTAEQSAEQGRAVPEGQRGSLKIGGWILALGAPTFGVWFLAVIICLSTFPWLGWFGRRVLVHGRQTTIFALIGMFALTGASGGLLENPQMGDASLILRMIVAAVLAAASVPALLWIFLKTRSAVIPAVAHASFSMGLAASMPFLAGGNPIIAPPQGLLVSAVALMVGVALWVWKDPGGEDLAVAGVAHDGSPLTPAALAQLRKEETAAPVGAASPAPPTEPDAGVDSPPADQPPQPGEE